MKLEKNLLAKGVFFKYLMTQSKKCLNQSIHETNRDLPLTLKFKTLPLNFDPFENKVCVVVIQSLCFKMPTYK
jgi:hypothetical protein